MSSVIPTVKIVDEDAPNGYVIINQSDYDPKAHHIFGAEGTESSGRRRGRTPKDEPPKDEPPKDEPPKDEE